MSEGEWHAVTWRYLGQEHVCDFDSELGAHAFARGLVEGRRENVAVVGPRRLEMDAGRAAALRARLMAATRGAHVGAVLREAAGGC